MSDKKVVLDYLVANSELAKSLESVTLEELLAHQADFDKCVDLLSRLPQLETNRLKLSNCLFDGVLPYDSLIGLCSEDLARLKELCNYLILPGFLCEMLDKVLKNGSDIKNYDFDINDCYAWAKIGDLRGLGWIWHNSSYSHRILERIAMYATEYDYVDCLEFACDRCVDDVDWKKYNLCNWAADYGSLACLRYAHSKNYYWDSYTSACAARSGNVKCLQYVHTQGCPWDEFVCAMAAMYGRLECLKYAHTHGCPWDARTYKYAEKHGHLDCLEYARAPDGDRSRGYPE